MKRILLSLFILLSLSEARASDTLTVRQVYNFSVGDTFDYKTLFTGYYAAGAGYIPLTTCYVRYIVTSKTFSLNNDTIFYTYTNSFPPNADCYVWGYATISNFFTNLDSTITYANIDSLDSAYDFISDTMQSYHDNLFNIINTPLSHQQYHGTRRYLEGHGLYLLTDTSDMGNIDGGPDYTDHRVTQLVYFSNGIQNFGTPYYILAGVNDITNIPQIHLYPNPTSDQIHLSISDMNGSDYQLTLTDILGQEVYTSSITQSESAHDISNLSPGMYTWRLMGNNGIIKSGKIVKD